MEQIADNVFVETGFFGSNDSMVVTGDGILLIDSPFVPTDALRWGSFVESKGTALYLVNTDDHIDHTLGNRFLPGEIISHHETRRKLVESPPSFAMIQRVLGRLDPPSLALMDHYAFRLPSVTLHDAVTLHLGGVGLELIHARGHTPNSLMAYLPEQRILFAGDNVCEGSLPTFQEACLSEWFETLDRILNMDVELIVPGHGKVCRKEDVALFRDQMHELVERVEAEIRAGVPRTRIVEEIRYQDRIHVRTESSPGYPEDMCEGFQRGSIRRIYDQLIERAQGA